MALIIIKSRTWHCW